MPWPSLQSVQVVISPQYSHSSLIGLPFNVIITGPDRFELSPWESKSHVLTGLHHSPLARLSWGRRRRISGNDMFNQQGGFAQIRKYANRNVKSCTRTGKEKRKTGVKTLQAALARSVSDGQGTERGSPYSIKNRHCCNSLISRTSATKRRRTDRFIVCSAPSRTLWRSLTAFR